MRHLHQFHSPVSTTHLTNSAVIIIYTPLVAKAITMISNT